MTSKKYLITLGAAVGLVGLLGGTFAADENSYYWEDTLRDQLMQQRQCELSLLSRIREYNLGGNNFVEVRAHCTDGRAFDAESPAADLKFKFRACSTDLC